MELDPAPGLFGKVSSHGDFLSRRLAPGVIALWDAWMQASLQGSRQQLGAAWLNTYLTSPIWRFALAPGVCDNHAWAGVLMPSVDRVGRHFPLLIAAGCAGDVPLAQWMGEQAAWFDQLEDLALSSLEANFNFDGMDAALQGMQALEGLPAAGVAAAGGLLLEIAEVAQAGEAAAALQAAALRGQSVWWTDGSDQVAPCVRMFRGLPSVPAFTAMLGAA